jgi:hypothetical protein
MASLAAARVREWVLSEDRLVFLVRDTTRERPERQGLELRFAVGGDASRYARDIGTDSAATFAARLSGSTDCFVVLSADHIVHATWVTRAATWTRELRRYVSPPDGDAYVYESFTRADARGGGLYPLALRAICADLRTRSVRRVWVGVEYHNVPSLRAVTKADFEEALTIPYRRTLGRVSVGRPYGPLAGRPDSLVVAADASQRGQPKQAAGNDVPEPP